MKEYLGVILKFFQTFCARFLFAYNQFLLIFRKLIFQTNVSNKRTRKFSCSFKLLMSSCTEPLIYGELEQLVLSHLKASQNESNRKVIDDAIAMTSTPNITDM